jgi:hypothetical protein
MASNFAEVWMGIGHDGMKGCDQRFAQQIHRRANELAIAPAENAKFMLKVDNSDRR